MPDSIEALKRKLVARVKGTITHFDSAVDPLLFSVEACYTIGGYPKAGGLWDQEEEYIELAIFYRTLIAARERFERDREEQALLELMKQG